MSKTNIAEIVIGMLGGVQVASELIPIHKSYVSKWGKRGRIPEKYWPRLVELKKGVTYELLHTGHGYKPAPTS